MLLLEVIRTSTKFKDLGFAFNFTFLKFFVVLTGYFYRFCFVYIYYDDKIKLTYSKAI